jgi:hypothetical protein
MRCGAAAAGCFWILTTMALGSETVVFHCRTSCKVYADGKLIATMPNGGIKQADLISGKKQVIVITRPGKMDWTHIVSLSRALAIDPDQKSPTEISDDSGLDRQNESTRTSSPLDRSEASRGSSPTKFTPSEAQAPALPGWADGDWKVRRANKKTFTFRAGSISCAASVDYDVRVHLLKDDTEHSRVDFGQDFSIDDESVACIEYDIQHEDRGEGYGQDFDLSLPIIMSVESQDRLSFTADMGKANCTKSNDKRCKLPEGQISGTIRRLSDSQIQVELAGPLPGQFTLDKD